VPRYLRPALTLAALVATCLAVPGGQAQAAVPPEVRVYYLADTNLDHDTTGLFSSTINGESVTTLVAEKPGVFLDYAQVSPDGSQVAYLQIAGGRTSLWTIEAGGFGAQLRRTFASGHAFQLRWSPDGTRLLFNDILSSDPRVRIYTLATGVTTVVPNSDYVANPTLDPSNPAYLVGNFPQDKVVRMTVSGGTLPSALAGSPLNTTKPVVSAAGTTVAFSHETSDDAAAPTADIMSLKGGVRKVLATGQDNTRPTLGPDNVVYFDKFADQAHDYIGDIYSVPIDGSSAAHRVTATPGVDEFSASAAVVDHEAPAGAITGLAAGVYGATPVLTWSHGDDPDVTDAIVCRATGTTAPTTPCAAPRYKGPATTYKDSGLAINGTYSYAVFATDHEGNVSTAPATTLTLQAIEAPVVAITAPTSTGTATPPFRVRWGVASNPEGTTYDLTYSVKGATGALEPFKPWLTGATSTTDVFGLGAVPTTVPYGIVYYVRAQATDSYGNKTLSSTNRGIVPQDETGGQTQYGKTGWVTESRAGRWGGTIHGTTTKGAAVLTRMTGTGYSVIGEKCTSCGQLRIYVDGVLKATVDSYASSYRQRQVLWTGSLGTLAARNVRVEAVGTAGRPRVNIDGFAFYR
jgi:hypothetical protein